MNVKKRMVLVILAMGLIFSPLVVADDDLAISRISIAESPPSVVYDQAQEVMDEKVYEALSVVVIDQDYSKIDFSPKDIVLKYSNAVGSQTVEVHYLGNDTYKESFASGKILITEPGKKNTRLVLKANPPAVGFIADRPALEKEVFDDLCIDVIDEDVNKVDFSRADIELVFDHNIGNQQVFVNYKGNATYNGSQALANVEITGKKDSKISLATNPVAIKIMDDSASLDAKVYDALKIQVTDVNDQKIDFKAEDIDISYNRAVGDQDVTVKYKGNDAFASSVKTAFIKITGKENTTVSLSKTPMPVNYNPDPVVLDGIVLGELKVRVLDSNQNEIKVGPEEIEISYNHEAGDQEVTIKYKGNETYYESVGSQKIIIINPQETAIVMAANPSEVNFDKDLKKLDQAIYEDLAITIRDVNNKDVSFKRDEIDLIYTPEIGDQEVLVKYKGNDNYKKTQATSQVKIVKAKQAEKIGIEIIIAISVILLAGIGFVVYRIKRQEKG